MKNILILLTTVTLLGCGVDGVKGPAGAKGTPGANCILTTVSPTQAAPNGGSLIKCPDGSESLVLNGATGKDGTNGKDGSNGVDGTNGSNGADGKDGNDGTPGTVIAPIKFCPGEPSYPSTFIEYGFCIQNNLYAVYSTNGGFMALIPPGRYTSNAVNSRCDFTVKVNCEIE